MSTDKQLDTEVAIAALRVFPQQVRSALLNDSEFRDRFSLRVDAVVRLNAGAEFTRSALFRAAREALGGRASSVEIASKDGTIWQVSHDSATGVIVSRESRVVCLSEFMGLSPDAKARLAWFDRQTTTFRVTDDRIGRWREILAERSLEDEEVDHLLNEFRLTPVHYASAIQ